MSPPRRPGPRRRDILGARLPPAIALAGALVGVDAHATSPSDPPWAIYPTPLYAEDLPTDLHPWTATPYPLGDLGACALVADDDEIAVLHEQSRLLGDADGFDGSMAVFHPERAMAPETTYSLRCDGSVSFIGEVSTGDADRVTPPPASIVSIDVRYEQGDPTDYMTVRATLEGAEGFFETAGYLEVRGDDGRVWPLTGDGHASPERFRDAFLAEPATFTVTPVAGNTIRGAPVVVAREDIERALVYNACAVDPVGAPSALLLGLALALRGRRRRGR